ncbi:MAG: rod shape-determining protein MreC [Candidatus Enterenecus sp.]
MKNFFRNNGALLVIIAVLLAAVLALGSFLLDFNPLTSIVNVLGTPFRAVSTAVANWTQDRYDRAFRYDELEAEVELLRRQVAELQDAARAGEDAARENERLRDLLGLSNDRPELVYEDATVTCRSSTNWGANLTVNKGSSSGVAVGDCVIDQYGNLVGIVSETGPNWSLVTTLLDPSVELGGRVARTDEDAIVSGDFTLMQEGRLKLSYLPENSQLVSGDQVTTSGLGELCPGGLTVGTILSLHTEADGISRYAVVDPAADMEGVRYVYIITDFGGAQ